MLKHKGFKFSEYSSSDSSEYFNKNIYLVQQVNNNLCKSVNAPQDNICCSVNPFPFRWYLSEEGKLSLHFLVKNIIYFYILWKEY